MKLMIPEDVLKKMTRMVDGRKSTEVELEVRPGELEIRLVRSGEAVSWSRQAYEASKIKIKRGKL